MDKFWGSSSNKMQLEQIFISWVLENYKGFRPIFLGGADRDGITSCIMISMELPAHSNFWNVTMKKQTTRCCFMKTMQSKLKTSNRLLLYHLTLTFLLALFTTSLVGYFLIWKNCESLEGRKGHKDKHYLSTRWLTNLMEMLLGCCCQPFMH